VKSGPGQAHVGDTITYTFQASVTNGVSASDVSISDPICDAGTLQLDSNGDGDALLEPGETWTYTCTHLVTASDLDPLLNTASVSGMNQGSSGSGIGSTSTDILHPSLDVRLTSDPGSGSPGDDVAWSYVVTNTGDVILHDLEVQDDLFGAVGSQDELGAFRLPRGKALAPGDSVRFTEDSTIPNQARPLEDTATAAALDPTGLRVTDADGWGLNIVLGRTVTPTKTPPGGLAFTGSSAVIPLGVVALLLFLVGSALLWASRERARHATRPQGD
jgi:plastocyanin